MVRRPAFRIVLMSALGLLSAAPRAQAPGPTSSSVTSISGRVIDGATGVPVKDAVVRIGGASAYATFDEIFSRDALDTRLRDSEVPFQVRTDRAGRFAFADLPPGAYGVTARLDGWTTGAYGATRPGGYRQWLDLSAGQRATVTIVIWRHPRISGIVVDDRGEPIERAAVQVLTWQLSAGRRALNVVKDFSTDDRGEYGGDVPPGDYIIRALSDRTRVAAWTAPDATMSGFPPTYYPSALSADSAEPIMLAPGARLTNVSFRLAMRPMRRLAGQLTNPAGIGKLPASITVISQDGLETRRGAGVDPQGRFLIERLFPGRYLLEASSSLSLVPGPEPMLWARALVDVQDADGVIKVPLHRGLSVRGRLEFDGAEPPATELSREFSVFTLMPPAVIGDVIPPRVQAAADGTFAIELPGGEYLARVFSGFNTEYFFNPGVTQPSDAELRALSEWRVRSVIANGQDILDTPLVLTTDVSDVVITLAKGMPSAQGRVRVRENRPQDYRVVLVPADPSWWAHPAGRRFAAVPVSSDGGFRVQAPPGDYLIGAVRGLPRDWRDGDLIARIATRMSGLHLPEAVPSVQIEPPAFDLPLERTRLALTTTTDAASVHLVPDASASLPLPASTGATVTGRVVSAEDGHPLADVRVSLYGFTGTDVFTDDEGRFILQRVSHRKQVFHASRRGWIEATGGNAGMVMTVNGDRIDDLVIRMARTAEITGVVYDQDGEPVEGLGVRAWKYQPGRDAVEQMNRSPDAWVNTDDRGRYRLPGLAPGRYLVATVPYIARDQTDIPATTEDDLDRAAGRAVPPGRLRSAPSRRGYPGVFNGGATDAAPAEPLNLQPGSTTSVDLQVRSAPLTTVTVTLDAPDATTLSRVDSHLALADRLLGNSSQLWEYPERQEAGTLVFENILPGRYAFGASARTGTGEYVSAFAEVQVTEAEQQHFAFDLMPGAMVSGRITVDGAPPAADAGLSIQAADISNRRALIASPPRVAVLEDGTFHMSLIPARYRFYLTRQGRTYEHVVVSQSVGGRETLHEGLEVSTGQEISGVHLAVASRGGEVTGVVRDQAGKPAAAATVVIFPADRAGWQPKSPHVLSVQTDGQGRYVLKNVPPGDYRLAAATLPPDVWLDAETLSGLFDRGIAAQVAPAGSLNIYLAVP